MPQHEIHFNIDDIMIGRKFPDIHQAMDIFSGEGPNHRRAFHDDQIVQDILNSTGSLEAAWSARYHLIADRVVRLGEPTQELPDNVRKESIIAEMMSMMAKGQVEIVMFPNSVLTELISSIINGTAKVVECNEFPALRENYYIKR